MLLLYLVEQNNLQEIDSSLYPESGSNTNACHSTTTRYPLNNGGQCRHTIWKFVDRIQFRRLRMHWLMYALSLKNEKGAIAYAPSLINLREQCTLGRFLISSIRHSTRQQFWSIGRRRNERRRTREWEWFLMIIVFDDGQTMRMMELSMGAQEVGAEIECRFAEVVVPATLSKVLFRCFCHRRR